MLVSFMLVLVAFCVIVVSWISPVFIRTGYIVVSVQDCVMYLYGIVVYVVCILV